MAIKEYNLKWSDGSRFHPVSNINAKTPFCCKQCSEHSFLIYKCSWKMNTLPSDIFNTSAILHNFNLWLAKMSWDFWCFPGQLPNLGDQCPASFVSVWQHLKSAYHLLTIVSDRAEFKQHLSSNCFAWTVSPHHQKAMLYQHDIQIFPSFWKFATLSKVGDLSRGWPEGSLFNSYYMKV